MGFIDWARRLFRSGKKTVDLKDCFYESGLDFYYKKLAVDTCIDLIANAISTCEFTTYEKGKKVRKNSYYMFNVRPNKNENASKFIHRLVTKLVYETECLVIMSNEELFIADDFEKEKSAFNENIYKNIVINDFKLSKVYSESEVMYYNLRDEKIVDVINGMYDSFGKLLRSSMNYYKRKNNKRYLIKGDFLRAQDDETQEAIDKMFESQLKNWFDPDKEGSAFQLHDAYEMEDMSDGQTAGSNNSGLSRDIAALVDDVFNYVAMAFHVPRALLKGDVSGIEELIDSFLMFAIKPLVENITDETNGKYYSKKEYLERTYLKIDTSKIKVTDITKLATALDKIFAIGGATISDVVEAIGGEPLNEDWANKRFVTKNYQDVTTLGKEKN